MCAKKAAQRRRKRQRAPPASDVSASTLYKDLFQDVQPEIVIDPTQWAKRHTSMEIKHLHQLILWVLTDAILHPGWLLVKHKPLVKQVLIAMVPHLDRQQASQLPFGRTHPLADVDMFPFRVPASRFSRDVMLQQFLDCRSVKLSGRKKVRKRRTTPKHDDKAGIRAQYLLSSRQRVQNNFPMEFEVDSSWEMSPTASQTEIPEEHEIRLLAMDCEMCTTKDGLELARISIVDENLDVVLDSFVLPSNPILDYNTRFSGITADTLADVQTRLEEVRERVLALLTSNPNFVLVGHSLENDLRALRLVHSRVMDTSVMFPHQSGLPFKSSLRFLAKRFLKLEIQQESHDSIEDARVAMRLALLKIEKGPSFGVDAAQRKVALTEVLSEHHRRVAMIDSNAEALQQFSSVSTSVHIAKNASDTCVQACKLLQRPDCHHFMLCHLRQLEEGGSIDNIHRELAALFEACSVGTAFVVVSGQLDSRPFVKLQKEAILCSQSDDVCRQQQLLPLLEQMKRQAEEGVLMATVKRT